MIIKNNQNISSIYKGLNAMQKVYKGMNLVWNKAKLPKEYQRVEYIENTNAQWIDIGIRGYNLIKLDAQGTAVRTVAQIIYGASANAGNWFGTYTNGKWGITSDGSYDYTTRRNITVDFSATRMTYTIDDETYSREATLETSKYFALFGLRTSTYHAARARIWSCKIFQNNTIVRDLIPCRRKADNKPGMYDIVNSRFYVNAGAGEFSVGPDI